MNLKIGASLNFSQNLSSELRIFKCLGYDYAELSATLSLPIRLYEKKLKKICNQFPILTLHLPQIDYKDNEIELCKKLIEISVNYSIALFIIHLYSINLPTSNNLEQKINALQDLADFAKSKNIILALENTEENVKILKPVFEAIPTISFCLDIGHANLFTENQSVNFIQHFGKRLQHIHVHDNLGGDHSDPEKYDIHLPVGEGNIQFKPIFEKLKEIYYSGNITIENTYKPRLEEREISIKRIRSLLNE